MNPFEKNWDGTVTEEEKKAYTEIVIVFDKSGSMAQLKQAVVDGYNEYVGKVRAAPGDNRWSLFMFDDPHSARGADEGFLQILFESKREAEVPKLTLIVSRACMSGGSNPVSFVPRGGTALTDALCEVIDRTELRTSGMDHVKVVVGIFTDGMENVSTKFTSPELRERLARTQTKKGWDYLYFGANQDAFAETGKAGLPGQMISGHLQAGASYTNSFIATNAGMQLAISSGMKGLFSVASGSLASGKYPQPTAIVGVP